MPTFGLSKIHCPCRKYENLYQFNLDYVREHIYKWGIFKLYKVWTFHGEVTIPIVDIDPVNEVEHISNDEEDDTFFDMLNDLRDAKVVGSGGVQRGDNNENMPVGELGGSYMSMFEKAQRDFLVKLMHVKVLNGWSNKSFDMLLQLLGEAFSKSNAIPSSHYEAKKMLRELGLGYKSIHACKNDCILFWNDHKGKDICPVCKEPRYKVNEANKKKIPQKVLRYFSLKPRLKRLFLSKHTAKNMRWHKEKREFDKLHETFANDPRNVRLRLETGGFNSFENMSNDEGVETYDASTERTIHDFPAYGAMSGWSIKGYKAYSVCLKDITSQGLCNKIYYTGHRRFLHLKHSWCKNKRFNGKFKNEGLPRTFSSREIILKLDALPKVIFSKHPALIGKQKHMIGDTNWVKKSIFFELEYWSDLKLRYNLDDMHIEKNICDALIDALLSLEGKSKDTIKARLDMQNMGIRSELHLSQSGDRVTKPHASYTFTLEEKCKFCHFLKSVKFPNGYAVNISRNVNVNDGKLYGLKTHDCHVLFQRLLSVAIRKFLPKDICGTVVELCDLFKKLTSRTLHVADLNKMGEDIVFILCKMEQIFSPAFLDIMVHLAVYLPREAILSGPILSRTLKKYVRNKARSKGSIAEGYVVNKALTFTSLYMGQIEIRFIRAERNKDVSQSILCTLSIFNQQVEFPLWFRDKMIRLRILKDPDATNELYSLVLGSNVEFRLYGACIVNDVRYHTISRDTCQTTQNSRVSIFFGVLKDVVILFYTSGYKVHLFWCDWFQCNLKNKSVVQEFGFTCIDTSKIWYEDDPFILATQARQVYYLDDIKCRGSWKVVQKVQHREIYEVIEKEDDNSGELESPSNEISLMVRDDLEIPHLCRVDIQPQHVELLDTQSRFSEDMHNFINDEDEDTELESNGEEQTFLFDTD
ncbi:hypothetical protein Pfo_003734 [Paulownia fortunei]|nr:hypothetical protein Pfo_003734 [Paulownia fortunei]